MSGSPPRRPAELRPPSPRPAETLLPTRLAPPCSDPGGARLPRGAGLKRPACNCPSRHLPLQEPGCEGRSMAPRHTPMTLNVS